MVQLVNVEGRTQETVYDKCLFTIADSGVICVILLGVSGCVCLCVCLCMFVCVYVCGCVLRSRAKNSLIYVRMNWFEYCVCV